MKKEKEYELSNCELIGRFVPSAVKGYYTLVPVTKEEFLEEFEKIRQEEKKAGK